MNTTNNNTPNQVGENQNSPTILNYHLNPLPGLGKILAEYDNTINLTEENIVEYFTELVKKVPKDQKFVNNQGYITRVNNFESEPE